MAPATPFRGGAGQDLAGKDYDSVKKGVAGTTGGPMRRRRIVYDAIRGVTRPSLRRLARRGGVRRISGGFYNEARRAMRDYLEDVLKTCVTYVEHRGAKTITVLDVLHALQRSGRTLYGFDPVTAPSQKNKRRL